MTPPPKNERGSALLTAAALTAVIASAVGGLMYYAGEELAGAVDNSRGLTRRACTEAGIQLARAFYGRNYVNWNTYLSNPAIYDPTVPPPALASNPWDPTLQLNHPELFTDLDGDG